MTNKKPVLYKARGMILPDKIEVREKIINSDDKIEEIYQIQHFNNIIRFNTLQDLGDSVELHRFYEMRDNDINTIKKINQRVYDREFRTGLGGIPRIPLLY